MYQFESSDEPVFGGSSLDDADDNQDGGHFEEDVTTSGLEELESSKIVTNFVCRVRNILLVSISFKMMSCFSLMLNNRICFVVWSFEIISIETFCKISS